MLEWCGVKVWSVRGGVTHNHGIENVDGELAGLPLFMQAVTLL